MTCEEQIIQESIKKYPRFPERRIGFIDGAQWEHKRLVEKASKWLINSFDHLHNEYHRKLEFGNQEVFIEAFKKAMEE